MINTIYSSKYISVTSTSSSSLYFSPGAQGAGLVRYNTNSHYFEVYDGLAWRQIGESVNVTLDSRAESAIGWALKKMEEEELYRELAEMYPAVAEARQKVMQAQAELAAVTELVK